MVELPKRLKSDYGVSEIKPEHENEGSRPLERSFVGGSNRMSCIQL